MSKIKNFWKTSIILIICLTCLMMAAASVNADRIREAPDLDVSNVEVLEHHSSNVERGDLIIAPAPTVEQINEGELDDLVISPEKIQINEDGEDPNNSFISPRNQNAEESSFNMGLPALVGIVLICGLLVLVLVFKWKK